jgi:hypothetical protein
MRKGLVALIGMTIGLVLLLVSFMGPWYTIHATGLLGTAEYSAQFSLTQMQLQRNIGGQDITLSMDYADAKMNVEGTAVNVESFAMIEEAMYLTILALVMMLLAIVFKIAFVFEKGHPRMMIIGGGLFGVLTFLFTILPALYFMNTKFVENISGFWFKVSILGIVITGGPGYAWYLMIIVAAITVVCTGSILVKRANPKMTNENPLLPKNT